MYQNKKLVLAFTIIGLATAGLIFFLGCITWNAGDDFVIPFQVMDAGFSNYVWSQYLKWDGRFLSAILYGLLFNNFYFEPFLGPVLVLLFFGNCFLLVLLATPHNSSKNNVYFFLKVIVVMWAVWSSGNIIINAETIYWYTGGVQYTIISFLGFLWLFFMRKIIHGEKTFRWPGITIPLFMLFSFFIGGGNQTLSPSLLCIIIIMLVLSGRKTKDNKFIFIALLFFVLGAAAMYFAPGNFARATSSTAAYSRGSLQLSPLSIIVNYFTVLFDFTKWAVPLLCITFIAFMSLAFIFNNNAPAEIPSTEDSGPQHGLLHKYKKHILVGSYCVAALINVSPFIIAPGYAVPRSSIFFRYFLVICILGIVQQTSAFIMAFLRSKKISTRPIALCIILFLGSGTFFFALLFSVQGYAIKKQFDERYEILKSFTLEQRNTEVKVEPVEGVVPLCYIQLFHGDIKTDKNTIFNVSVARRYKLKSVALSSPYTKVYRLFSNVPFWKKE